MADEATINVSLQVRKGFIDHRSAPTAYRADVSAVGGPTPGQFTVSTAGTDLDLSELEAPGLCWMQNLDEVNYVEYGTWDPEMLTFYPLGELLPGEINLVRLSRNLFQEYGTGPGTGTIGPQTNRVRFRAYNAPVKVIVHAFER